jgi:deoxyribonuclease-4
MSISGGMHTAFTRGASIGCTTMQVFTKSNSRWTGKPHSAEEIALFRAAAARSTIRPVVAHAAYLINLCASHPETLKKSRAALIDELERCETLEILGLIVHPGAHVGAGEADGIKRIVESLNLIHETTPGFRTLSILETTAGQGSSLGHRFEQLHAMIDALEEPGRVAVCLDTCHVFAAGYDISTPAGWESTFRMFDDLIGLERLAAIHVNDSMRERGSRVDRHAHIGKGMIGLEAFRMLMNDPRLIEVPKILETAKSDDMHEDVENMNLLRSLVD